MRLHTEKERTIHFLHDSPLFQTAIKRTTTRPIKKRNELHYRFCDKTTFLETFAKLKKNNKIKTK